MIEFIIRYIWNSVWGWIGVGGIIILGALAWAWFMPMFRKTALNVALITAITISVYAKGTHDEYVRYKAHVAKQEKKAREAGDHARADALKHANDGVRDPWDSDDN